MQNRSFPNELSMKLNRLFMLMLLFTTLAFMLVFTNMIAPQWAYSLTQNSYIMKICLSVLLVGIFGCLNSSIILIIKHLKQAKQKN
jgi:hypothetical protein